MNAACDLWVPESDDQIFDLVQTNEHEIFDPKMRQWSRGNVSLFSAYLNVQHVMSKKRWFWQNIMDIHSSFNLITILSDQKKRNLRNDLISEEEIEKKRQYPSTMTWLSWVTIINDSILMYVKYVLPITHYTKMDKTSDTL